MNVDSVTVVYFSPTGTSKKITEGIVKGINPATSNVVDLTDAERRNMPLHVSDKDLLVVAVPVYMGRVPALVTDWLSTLTAQKTPVVCIVVYGNRVYDNALLELKDTLAARGCVPVAGAAYVGEHSFSSEDIPVAHGRPDSGDLAHAEAFGRAVRDKMDAVADSSAMPELHVAGSRPYEGMTTLWDVDFIEVADTCTQCGVCAQICPLGAIDSQNSALVDIAQCITCCACIKRCPQQARSIKPSLVKDASLRLNNLFSAPKQPENFL